VGARRRRAEAGLSAAAGRQRAFSLLELVIVIVLISLLLGVGIDRLLLMKAQAESRAMEHVLGSMRSGLTIRMAEMLARGRVGEIAELAGSNPMRLLVEPTPNYLGELFGPDPAVLPTGSWYFDTRERALCYLVDSAEYFRTPLASPARARFRIEPVFDAAIVKGLRLAALEPYGWNLTTWRDPGWAVSPKAPAGGPG
jgi:prepilin-type N-terminal cleavage/methylation domain-containing protein